MIIVNKMLKILGILIVQISTSYIVAKLLLKLDWNIIKFVTDPGIITFLVTYITLDLLISVIKQYKQYSKK